MSSAFVLTTFLRLTEMKKRIYLSLNSSILGCTAACSSLPAAPAPFDRAYVESLKGVSLTSFCSMVMGCYVIPDFLLMV
jgi:hypothetical protein